MKLVYLIPLVAYLLGSIPFGFLIVRLVHGADVRKQGSGNIGATNVYRKSRTAGILTLLLDGGKGYLAVLAAAWMSGDVVWQAAAAVAAIVGHVFTVWLGFKGGKGVATGCGAYLAISPLPCARHSWFLSPRWRSHATFRCFDPGNRCVSPVGAALW